MFDFGDDDLFGNSTGAGGGSGGGSLSLFGDDGGLSLFSDEGGLPPLTSDKKPSSSIFDSDLFGGTSAPSAPSETTFPSLFDSNPSPKQRTSVFDDSLFSSAPLVNQNLFQDTAPSPSKDKPPAFLWQDIDSTDKNVPSLFGEVSAKEYGNNLFGAESTTSKLPPAVSNEPSSLFSFSSDATPPPGVSNNIFGDLLSSWDDSPATKTNTPVVPTPEKNTKSSIFDIPTSPEHNKGAEQMQKLWRGHSGRKDALNELFDKHEEEERGRIEKEEQRWNEGLNLLDAHRSNLEDQKSKILLRNSQFTNSISISESVEYDPTEEPPNYSDAFGEALAKKFKRCLIQIAKDHKFDLRKEFRKMDTDHSGAVSRGELRNFIDNLHVDFREEEVNVLLHFLDSSEDGEIDMTEFRALQNINEAEVSEKSLISTSLGEELSRKYHDDTSANDASSTIQRVYRGHLGRIAYNNALADHIHRQQTENDLRAAKMHKEEKKKKQEEAEKKVADALYKKQQQEQLERQKEEHEELLRKEEEEKIRRRELKIAAEKEEQRVQLLKERKKQEEEEKKVADALYQKQHQEELERQKEEHEELLRKEEEEKIRMREKKIAAEKEEKQRQEVAQKAAQEEQERKENERKRKAEHELEIQTEEKRRYDEAERALKKKSAEERRLAEEQAQVKAEAERKSRQREEEAQEAGWQEGIEENLRHEEAEKRRLQKLEVARLHKEEGEALQNEEDKKRQELESGRIKRSDPGKIGRLEKKKSIEATGRQLSYVNDSFFIIHDNVPTKGELPSTPTRTIDAALPVTEDLELSPKRLMEREEELNRKEAALALEKKVFCEEREHNIRRTEEERLRIRLDRDIEQERQIRQREDQKMHEKVIDDEKNSISDEARRLEKLEINRMTTNGKTLTKQQHARDELAFLTLRQRVQSYKLHEEPLISKAPLRPAEIRLKPPAPRSFSRPLKKSATRPAEKLRDVASLSVAEVGVLLRHYELTLFVEVFRKKHVDGRELAEFEFEEDIAVFNVGRRTQQMKLLHLISDLRVSMVNDKIFIGLKRHNARMNRLGQKLSTAMVEVDLDADFIDQIGGMSKRRQRMFKTSKKWDTKSLTNNNTRFGLDISHGVLYEMRHDQFHAAF